jgi:hypothetical protein
MREGSHSDPKGVWGQRSSVSHVSRLLKALRQSLQKSPSAGLIRETRRPSSAGKNRGGLPSKKGTEGRQETIAFADQSGFYLLPTVVRTYAPAGKTPILKENLTRDHLFRR